MSQSRLLATASAAVLGAAMLAPAHAADINMTGWAFGTGQSVNVAAPTYNGQAGAFKGVLTNAGVFNNANLITYCVELGESFALPSNMTGYSVMSGASYFAAGVAAKLGKLMTYAYSNPTFVDNSAESGSLQLAIWNTIYDNDLTLGGGAFKNTTNVGINALADSFLSNAVATTTKFNVYVLRKVGSQDFLLLQAVPAPASLALAALGLAALGATSRRRSKQA
ncbi:MAG: thioester domain-containing protein [Rubrivivax sp.]|nr:thioester domain-containing protein [Rubrivivax sp.]